MVDVPVNGGVLGWARKERRLSVKDAAALLDVEPEQITALESGEEKPNLGQLRYMAQKYGLPLATLLMPEPLPTATRPVVLDYRTHASKRPHFSQELQQAIDEEWEYIDALYDLKDAAPDLFPNPEVIPHVSAYSDMEKVAAEERARIGFPVAVQLGLKTNREAFLRWRDAVERQGVFVHVRNLGDSDNARGFAINDERGIPLIFLNSDETEIVHDYKSRIFGLFHEYCHVMMRQNVLSDHARSNAVEAACNKFAAFFLMPRKDILERGRALGLSRDTASEFHVRKLSQAFHTSMSSVAIHLETLGLARPGFYDRLMSEWRKRTRNDSGGMASHEEKLANRFGARYIDLVLRARQRGLLNNLDVLEMTNIKPEYVRTVSEEVSNRIAAYGRP